MTSPRGEGAEAWLKFHQRAATQLVHLPNADLSGDLEDKTLLWERTIKTCEGQTEKVFAEDLRIGIWLSNAPGSTVKTHMLRGNGKKGKGKGKGKNGKGVASHDKCGKSSHTADQCLADHVCSKCGYNGHCAEKCSSKNPTSAIAPLGEGEQVKRKCFDCGKTGHLAASCQSKKNPWRPSRTIEDGPVPVQGDDGSLTLFCHDDDLNNNYMLGSGFFLVCACLASCSACDYCSFLGCEC